MKTPQETFDTVARALAAQGRPSVSAETCLCRYRGDNGTKCAVGHLIPDELYRPELEGNVASTLCIREITEALGHNRVLVRELQHAHDNAYDDSSPDGWLKLWAGAMRNIAEDWGLSMEALEAALAARGTA